MTGRSESQSDAGSVIAFRLDGEAAGLSILLPRRHRDKEIREVRVNGAERAPGAVSGYGTDFAAIVVDLDGRNPLEVSVAFGSPV